MQTTLVQCLLPADELRMPAAAVGSESDFKAKALIDAIAAELARVSTVLLLVNV